MIDEDSDQELAATKVVVANLSGAVLEINTTAVRQQPDLVITYSTEDLTNLTDVTRNEIDVLIIGAPYGYPLPAICRDLWSALAT